MEENKMTPDEHEIIKQEFAALIGFTKDESLPADFRSELRNDLIEMRKDMERTILEFSEIIQ